MDVAKVIVNEYVTKESLENIIEICQLAVKNGIRNGLRKFFITKDITNFYAPYHGLEVATETALRNFPIMIPKEKIDFYSDELSKLSKEFLDLSMLLRQAKPGVKK